VFCGSDAHGRHQRSETARIFPPVAPIGIAQRVLRPRSKSHGRRRRGRRAKQNKTLTISRAVEETKKHGRGTKEPKTQRGHRTIKIDDGLIAMLAAERGAAVDLSLVKLPDGDLMFPGADGTKLTKLRDAHAVTRIFKHRVRKLGFPDLRFHDLRGSHETLLLDKGVPVHVVAARCGHDAAVLLHTYAKRTKKADSAAADAISALSAGVLGGK
jgi:integrase